ncbi:hypothetical protein [Microbacterium proteolyticum]|uniref:hypothetical protein n=1 Tax=Microbacterium proteolyticum TaxID=1572644 RepID=UPI0027D7D60E|nr:hypothetical protein [Microbacterium proteolyticum]
MSESPEDASGVTHSTSSTSSLGPLAPEVMLKACPFDHAHAKSRVEVRTTLRGKDQNPANATPTTASIRMDPSRVTDPMPSRGITRTRDARPSRPIFSSTASDVDPAPFPTSVPGRTRTRAAPSGAAASTAAIAAAMSSQEHSHSTLASNASYGRGVRDGQC